MNYWIIEIHTIKRLMKAAKGGESLGRGGVKLELNESPGSGQGGPSREEKGKSE